MSSLPSPSELQEYYKWQGKAGNHQKRMYEEAGDVYTLWWQNKRCYWIRKLIDNINCHLFLDVGCAEGLFTRFEARHGAYSVGIDISSPKLRRAKAYDLGMGLSSSTDYILADAEHLPFLDNLFDTVLCMDVIRYLRNPINAIYELFRVSKSYIVIQSGTNSPNPVKNFSSKIFFRDPRYDFKFVPFGGHLWIITPAFLAQFGKTKGVTTREFIGHFQHFFVGIISFCPLRKSRVIIKIIDRLDDLLATKPIFKFLGRFTTVMFQKQPNSRK